MDAVNGPRPKTAGRKLLAGVFHRLSSLKLAVVLLAVLAGVIGAATVVETEHGRPYAQWYVYHSGWFIGLLALLGLNIFSAAASRWPWRRHQTGFVITHAGLLVLLAGSIQTFRNGIEGHVTLAEGGSATTMAVSDAGQVTASWADRPGEPPYEYTFSPGPADWPEGTTLDVGEVDGLGVRVLRYVAHARPVEEWVPDDAGSGGPLVTVTYRGRDGAESEHTLVDQDFGDEAFTAAGRVQLRRATGDAMVADFLNPPTEGLGTKGLLIAYFGGRAERIPVEGGVGKRLNIGDTGAAVEIVRYLANGRPDAHARFESAGDEPRNPMLELQVYSPGEAAPIKQITFAKRPLVNLDGVYGRVCPVSFCYLHPASAEAPAVELLQSAAGKLHCRLVGGGRYSRQDDVATGGTIRLADGGSMTVAQHLPSVRGELRFEPVDGDPVEKAEPAAEVEVTFGGSAQRLWLQRNHQDYGTQTIATEQGPLRVRFGTAEVPLGFTLRLANFRRGVNPGGVGNATFSSVVRVTDSRAGVDEEREISMNEPLTYNGLTFYQSGFNEGGQGAKTSTLSVARDPGRTMKYAGSLMICLGIAVMFYMRAYFFKPAGRPATVTQAAGPAVAPPEPAAVGADV